VSIVAELVAVRRGAAPERGWVPPARVRAQAERLPASTQEEESKP
jgi:hypothetical protein